MERRYRPAHRKTNRLSRFQENAYHKYIKGSPLPIVTAALLAISTIPGFARGQHHENSQPEVAIVNPYLGFTFEPPTAFVTTPPTTQAPPIEIAHPPSLPPPTEPTTTITTQTPEPEQPQRVQIAGNRNVVITPVDPISEVKIEAMNLTVKGYIEYWKSIDTSFFDEAQQFPEFNGKKVNIWQGPTQIINRHFTVTVPLGDGVSLPTDQIDYRRLIASMAHRGDKENVSDKVCCGINWFTSPTGQGIQAASVDAKLRHNLGFDGTRTGVEDIAASQAAVTTAQYEADSYLIIGILLSQGILEEDQPMFEREKGHGEETDAFQITNPQDEKLECRNDYDEPVMSKIRAKEDAFLKENPDIRRIIPAFDENGKYAGLNGPPELLALVP